MKTNFHDPRLFPTPATCRACLIRARPWTLLFGLALLFLLVPPLQAKDTNDVKEETVKKKVFDFEGGSPLDLIVALDRHFRTRLVQILTLPETLSRTKVPKMRVAAEDPREVLTVYNRLQSPTLGQWHYEPEGTAPTSNPNARNTNVNMNALMLVPDKAVVANKMERSEIRVKGLPLAGVPEAKWEALLSDIEAARAYGLKASTNGMTETLEGSVRFQKESKVLIAAGSDAYIQMVDSLVSAHRVNAEFESKTANTSKYSTSGGHGK